MMLQDIYPHKLNNQYDPAAKPRQDDTVLVFDGRRVLARSTRDVTDPSGDLAQSARDVADPSGNLAQSARDVADSSGDLAFPEVSILPAKEQEKLIYLFSVDEEQYFLYPQNEVPFIPSSQNGESSFPSSQNGETSFPPSQDGKPCFLPPQGSGFDAATLFPGFEFMELNALREKETPPKYRMFAAYTGKHLADWYRDTRFCGRCGCPTKHSETERAQVCTACGYTTYPRIMPAVIVGITNGDRLLLTRYRTGYAHNALVAGFTEIGETVEETVSREAMEETGLKVKNIRYYKSQPWGAANDILMGFYCDVDGDDTIRMDDNELKYAAWIQREEIELQPDESSLTNEMMKMFKEGRQ